MSFFRYRGKPTVTPDRGVKRARRTSASDDDAYGAGKTAYHQRPLSVVLRRTVEPSKIEDSAAQQSTLHGATQDAVVLADSDARTVLPQWKNSSVGW